MRKKREYLVTSVILIICMMMTACGENPQASDFQEGAGSQQAVNVQEGVGSQQAVNVQDDTDSQQTSISRDNGEEQQISARKDAVDNREVTQEQVMTQMSDEQKNWMGGLDEARRLEDFASLCDGLRENYPYLVLAKRQAGADIDVLEETYREKVKSCTNDNEFYEALNDFVGEFAGTGHLDLWGRRYESELESWRKIGEDLALKDKCEPYIAALDNPVSHKTYASMTAFYQEVDRQVQERMSEEPADDEREKKAEEGGKDKGAVLQTEYETEANVVTRILEPGKTAYISIGVFDHEQMEADRGILLPFYEEIWDYDNLMIDITDNPGGSMSYFNDLVAAPLTKETLTVPTYQFFKKGQNNGRFLKIKEGIASGAYQHVRNLPDLPELNREDVADCAYFMREDYTVHPLGSGFDGKIWLLVSSTNYSSSEYAAMFSKATGFATLVGENTSGDGIGTDPVYLILPNSGLVVQYSPMYGVTADGTGSEEYGTVPDIVSPPGESALDTCMRCIEQK